MAILNEKVYRIVPANNPSMFLAIVGGSSLAGAKIEIQPYANNTAQLYYVNGGNYLSPQCTFDYRSRATINMLLGTDSASPSQGDYVKTLSTASGKSSKMQLYYELTGDTFAVNGYSYPAYKIKTYSGLVFDSSGTYITVSNWTNSNSQKFAIIEDTFYDNAVPSQSISMNNLAVELNKSINSQVRYNITTHSQQQCQSRIRVATLAHNSNTFSDYVTKDKDANFETQKLEGTQFECIFYSTVQSSKLTMSGAAFPNSYKDTVERAVSEGYCLLRDFTGLYCYVAITNVAYSKIGKNMTAVNLTFVETDKDENISIPY